MGIIRHMTGKWKGAGEYYPCALQQDYIVLIKFRIAYAHTKVKYKPEHS